MHTALDDPAPEPDHLAGLDEHGQEVVGELQPVTGSPPPDQRLEVQRIVAARRPDRLVVDFELVPLERLAELGPKRQLDQCMCAHLDIEDDE